MGAYIGNAKRLALTALLICAVSGFAITGSRRGSSGADVPAATHQASLLPFGPLQAALGLAAAAVAVPAELPSEAPADANPPPAPAAPAPAIFAAPGANQPMEVQGVPVVNRLVQDESFATWDLILRLADGSFLPVHESGLNLKVLTEARAYAELALNLGKQVSVRGRIDPLGFLKLDQVDFDEGHGYLTDRGEAKEVEIPAQVKADTISYQQVAIGKLLEDKSLQGQAVEVKGIPAASKFEFHQGVGVWNLLISGKEMILLAYESGYNIDILSRLAALGELARQTGQELTLQGHYDAEAQILNLRHIMTPDGRVFDTDMGDKPTQESKQDYQAPEIVVIEKEVPAGAEAQETVRVIEKEVPVYVDREVPVYYPYPVYVPEPYPVYTYYDPWPYRYRYRYRYYGFRYVFVYGNYCIFNDVALVNVFCNNGQVNFNQVVVINQSTQTTVNQSTNTTVVNSGGSFRPPAWHTSWEKHRNRYDILRNRLRNDHQNAQAPAGLTPKRERAVSKHGPERRDRQLPTGGAVSKAGALLRARHESRKQVTGSSLVRKSEPAKLSKVRSSRPRITKIRTPAKPTMRTTLKPGLSSHLVEKTTRVPRPKATALTPRTLSKRPGFSETPKAQGRRGAETRITRTPLQSRRVKAIPRSTVTQPGPERRTIVQPSAAPKVSPSRGQRHSRTSGRTPTPFSSRLSSVTRAAATPRVQAGSPELRGQLRQTTGSSRASARALRQRR